MAEFVLVDASTGEAKMSMSVRLEASAAEVMDAVPRDAFIDGNFVPAVSGETFDCVTPVTGAAVGSVACCGIEDVDRCRPRGAPGV